MKIVILTNGTRGDVQPLIYLAQGLNKCGHTVTVVASDNFSTDIKTAGLIHASMPINMQEYMDSEEGQKWIKRLSRNPFALISEVIKMIPKLARSTVDAYWDASQDADLIITTTGALGDIYIKEILNIPLIEVHLQPLYPTGDFPYPLMNLKFRNRHLCLFSYYFFEQILRLMFKKPLKKWQEETFKQIRKYKGGPFAGRRRINDLKLAAFSNTLVPRPYDWPVNYKNRGYFYSPDEKNYNPDKHLIDFLNNEPAPIYIGFGSMQIVKPERFFSMIFKILEEMDIRIILSKGWSDYSDKIKSEKLIIVDQVSHSWLFPQTAGIIHHGGSGTTAAALKAGKPQMIFPQTADQPFWAYRVAALGLAPKPVKIAKIKPGKLQKGLNFMLSEGVKQKAEEIGKMISNEKGIETAVKLINETLFSS